jgi:hypothetical protein
MGTLFQLHVTHLVTLFINGTIQASETKPGTSGPGGADAGG